MIFVVELYLKSRRAKVVAWEKACAEWIAADTYGYRDKRAWVRQHPYPVFQYSRVLRVLVPLVCVLLVFGTIASAIVHNNSNQPNKPKQATAKVEKKGDIKVGDKVQVVYGTFKDSVGEAIKVGEGDAIIKLTNSTYTKAMADVNNNSSLGQDNGTLLKISSLDNLVPYKETK